MIQPTKWSVPLGSEADVQELPDDDLKFASFSKIFPQITQVPLSAGGVAPRRVDFNSLFKLLADNIYFYQNGGVFEYSDTADYERGALVRYNDKIYLCIQDNSALNAHNPEDMDYWLRVVLNNELENYQPCGSYIQHAGDSAPSGFLVCNGGAVSRTTYAKLFSVIGTKYGDGDGSTTFNLPNLIGRFLEGGTASGTVFEAGLPNITGSFCTPSANQSDVQLTVGTKGAIFYDAATFYGGANGISPYLKSGAWGGITLDASRSNAIYGSSSTVQPNAVTCLICIKY